MSGDSFCSMGDPPVEIPFAFPNKEFPDTQSFDADMSEAISPENILSGFEDIGQNKIRTFCEAPGAFRGNPKNWSSNVIVVTPSDPEFMIYKNQTGIYSQDQFQNEHNVVATNPAQLSIPQPNPFIVPTIKSVACSMPSQTNTRLCGSVQTSESVDEYYLNCFYCCDTFPLEKYCDFKDHLKDKHFAREQAFEKIKYPYNDHDYTSTGSPELYANNSLIRSSTKKRPMNSFKLKIQSNSKESENRPFNVGMAETLMELLNETLLNPNFRHTDEDNILVIKSSACGNDKPTNVMEKIMNTNSTSRPQVRKVSKIYKPQTLNPNLKTIITLRPTPSPNKFSNALKTSTPNLKVGSSSLENSSLENSVTQKPVNIIPTTTLAVKPSFFESESETTSYVEEILPDFSPPSTSKNCIPVKLSKPPHITLAPAKKITVTNTGESIEKRVAQQTLKKIRDFETMYKSVKTHTANALSSGVFYIKNIENNKIKQPLTETPLSISLKAAHTERIDPLSQTTPNPRPSTKENPPIRTALRRCLKTENMETIDLCSENTPNPPLNTEKQHPSNGKPVSRCLKTDNMETIDLLPESTPDPSSNPKEQHPSNEKPVSRCLKRDNMETIDRLSKSTPNPSSNPKEQHLSNENPVSRCLEKANMETIDLVSETTPEPEPKTREQPPSTNTPLSNCHKNANKETIDTLSETTPSTTQPNTKEVTIDPLSETTPNITQPNTKELVFQFTPRHIILDLLDNIKNYPVLWEFHSKANNENYAKTILELCKIVNHKWSLTLTPLAMRRSISRILSFYRYMLSSEKVDICEDYFQTCSSFLPSFEEDIPRKRCEYCDICYATDAEWRSHLVEEHEYLNWVFKCDHCLERFKEQDQYELHKQLPHYVEVFKCHVCNSTFNSLFILISHKRRAHRPRKLVREAPDITSPESPKKSKKCDECDKKFSTSSELACHKKYHREKLFKCHLCPKEYYQKNALTVHLKRHSQQLDFVCEVCGKAFLKQSYLSCHMEKHTGEKITCNICHIQLRKCSLSRHLRLCHVAKEGTVESTYRAQWYHYKKFESGEDQDRHPRPFVRSQEEGPRIYDCKKCNIPFDRLKFLKDHNNEVHADINTMICKICNIEFRHTHNIKIHYRQKHNLSLLQVHRLHDKNEDLDKVLNYGSLKRDDLNDEDDYDDSDDDPEQAATADKTRSETHQQFYAKEYDGTTQNSNHLQDEIMKAVENIDIQQLKTDNEHLLSEFFTDL